MIKKRGQVTVYVVIGIVILFTLIVFSYLLFSGRMRVTDVFGSEFDQVKVHIDSCVYQVLENGINFHGSHHGVGYEENLEYYILDHLPLCIDFSRFKRVEVDAFMIEDVDVTLTDEKAELDVVFPVTVRREMSEKKFSKFHAEFELIERGCVNIDVDANCKATESKTVEVMNLILSYNIGDFVGVGNECIAC